MTAKLLTLTDLIPSWSPRRINEACRRGDIPGAIKVGRDWMIREDSWNAWLDKASTPVDTPSIDEAAAVLRKILNK